MQVVVIHTRHADVNIDAVKQRPRDFARVPLDLPRTAFTNMVLISIISAWTRIHRRYQNDTRGKRQRRIRTRHRNLAILDRLAQHLKCLLAELRQFIQKEHAVMRECHLARTRDAPAADHRHRR